MAALQSAHTFLHLSLAYTEILPICDDSAVHRNTISRRLSASMEHSKEVSLSRQTTSMQCVQHTKAFTSTGYTPACQQLPSLSFSILQYHQEHFCKSVIAANLPVSYPPPTSLINYSQAISILSGRRPLAAVKILLLSSQLTVEILR